MGVEWNHDRRESAVNHKLALDRVAASIHDADAATCQPAPAKSALPRRCSPPIGIVRRQVFRGEEQMARGLLLTELPDQGEELDSLEIARGSFGRIMPVNGGLVVSGWMLLPDREFESVQVHLDGRFGAAAEVDIREELGRWLWSIRHAKRSGFRAVLSQPRSATTGVLQLDVLGCVANRPIARMSTWFRQGLDTAVPSPPAALMERVAAGSNPHQFKINGFRCFGEFLGPIRRHCDVSALRRMLDWGCGCGRVTAHFIMINDGPQVFGCDIDAEAIAWCHQNLPGGAFRTIAPLPPTAYQDEMFELVIGYSVLTHLTRQAQEAWLAEIRRILTPGGLFLASTHGEFATSFAFPRDKVAVLEAGIVDEKLDPALRGIAPEGYYRSTYQSRDYTVREYSKYFEILEYLPRAIGGFQDLVVMRRPR